MVIYLLKLDLQFRAGVNIFMTGGEDFYALGKLRRAYIPYIWGRGMVFFKLKGGENDFLRVYIFTPLNKRLGRF